MTVEFSIIVIIISIIVESWVSIIVDLVRSV